MKWIRAILLLILIAGVLYGSKGEYDLAIKDFNRAIELNPNNFFAYNNRGNAYDKIEDFDRAIEDFNAAIKLKSDYAKAYNNRGNGLPKKR